MTATQNARVLGLLVFAERLYISRVCVPTRINGSHSPPPRPTLGLEHTNGHAWMGPNPPPGECNMWCDEIISFWHLDRQTHTHKAKPIHPRYAAVISLNCQWSTEFLRWLSKCILVWTEWVNAVRRCTTYATVQGGGGQLPEWLIGYYTVDNEAQADE